MKNTYENIIRTVIHIHSNMDIDCSTPSKIKIISEAEPLNNLKYSINKYSREVTGMRLDIDAEYLDFLTLQAYGIYRKFKVNGDTYRVKISVNSNRGNTCWERYVTTKELSHILMGDAAKTHTKDIVELISDLLNEADFVKSNIKEIVETEYLSMILAMELLVPYCHNAFLIDKNNTSLDIATIFSIPEKIIDFMKKESYQTLRKTMYSKLAA